MLATLVFHWALWLFQRTWTEVVYSSVGFLGLYRTLYANCFALCCLFPPHRELLWIQRSGSLRQTVWSRLRTTRTFLEEYQRLELLSSLFSNANRFPPCVSLIGSFIFLITVSRKSWICSILRNISHLLSDMKRFKSIWLKHLNGTVIQAKAPAPIRTSFRKCWIDAFTCKPQPALFEHC